METSGSTQTHTPETDATIHEDTVEEKLAKRAVSEQVYIPVDENDANLILSCD